jgi:hypothetical protein
MGSFLQDLQFGTRLLWKDKGLTLAVLLTLAVCIGANAAILSVVHSVLLRPLPFAESDRVVLSYNSYPRAGVIRGGSGVPDYYDRLRDVTTFEQIAMYRDRPSSRCSAPKRCGAACSAPKTARSAASTRSSSATRLGSGSLAAAMRRWEGTCGSTACRTRSSA